MAGWCWVSWVTGDSGNSGNSGDSGEPGVWGGAEGLLHGKPLKKKLKIN